MPILLNNNPNKQAIMLGQHHLRKVMVGGDVVWQKHRRGTSLQDLSLETLEYRGVKLKATNQDGNLSVPMFFPAFQTDDWQNYLNRLTFIGGAELSLQTIDAMLEADVVGLDMLFPMFFFDNEPPDEYDFRRKLTFISNLYAELALESMDGLLVAEVRNNRDMYFPFVFPANRPTSRLEFLDKLTFIAKGDDEIDPDFVKDFEVNAYCPVSDYIHDFGIESSETIDFTLDFEVNAYNPATDYIKDFEVETEFAFWKDFSINAVDPVKDFIKDFDINAYDPARDFVKDFAVNVIDPARDFIKDFGINAFDPAKDFIKDFIVAPADPRRDFVKDFILPTIRTVDFTKSFTVPVIRTVDFTKNFNVPAIRTVDFTKNFNVPAIITRDFTKNFTVQAPAAGGDIVVVWVETTNTITLRPVSGITTYFVVPFMYMGTPVTRTYNAILTVVRNHHGASLTGREMTVQASNANISVPGAKYVVFVPQINAQSVTIIGNVVNRGMWFFSNTHVQGNVTNFGTMSGGNLSVGGHVPNGQLTFQGNITNEAPLPRIH